MFIHSVYFWLKEGTPASEQAALIASCNDLLTKIPSVKQLWAGKPAMTPREVVDNSYSVGLTVILDDDAGHEVYQKHEKHLEFIAKHKAHWQKVLIYDFK